MECPDKTQHSVRTLPSLNSQSNKYKMKYSLFLITLAFGLVNCGHSHKSNLRKSIFADYDAKVKPDEQTKVDVALEILDLNLCAHAQTLSTRAWLFLMWNDSRLSWDSSEWHDIDRLRLPFDQVWLPDLSVYNAKNELESNYVSWAKTSHVVVLSGGTVIWVPPITMDTFCKPNLENWPWGKQSCELKFGSWTYDLSELDVAVSEMKSTFDQNGIGIDNFKNDRVKVVGTKSRRDEKEYPCCAEEKYPSLVFTLEFETVAKFKHGKVFTEDDAEDMHDHDSSEEDM